MSRDNSCQTAISSLPDDLIYLLRAENWDYVAEGNRNLVVRFNGSQQLETRSERTVEVLNRIILRIRKHDEKDALVGLDELLREVEISSDYNRLLVFKVLRLPFCYAPRLPILLDSRFLNDLEAQLDRLRPSSRKSKTMHLPDLPAAWATIATDHLCLPRTSSNEFPTISLEIKPKWGFMPFTDAPSGFIPPFVDSKEVDVKRTTCRYCMHTYLRRKQLPLFCPMDLFSPERNRQVRALRGLIDEAGKVEGYNNLRTRAMGTHLDSNGIRDLFGSEGSDFWTAFLGAEVEDPVSCFLELVAAILSDSRVLERLAEHQRLLAPLEINGIYSIYGTLDEEQLQKLSAREGNTDWLSDYLSESSEQRAQLGFLTNDEILGLSEEQKLAILDRFAASMTLRDVSLLISVRRTESESLIGTSSDPQPSDPVHSTLKSLLIADLAHTTRIATANGTFEYTLRIADADPKSAIKVPKWYQADREILDNWNSRSVEIHRDCR